MPLFKTLYRFRWTVPLRSPGTAWAGTGKCLLKLIPAWRGRHTSQLVAEAADELPPPADIRPALDPFRLLPVYNADNPTSPLRLPDPGGQWVRGRGENGHDPG